MGSDFKFNLIKKLKGSHKYFHELNKPTLRIIIKSTYSFKKCIRNKINIHFYFLQSVPNILKINLVLMKCWRKDYTN